MTTYPGQHRTGLLRLRRGVIFRSFATETVLLDMATGEYYGLDAVGGRLLEALAGAATMDEAADALAVEGLGQRSELLRDLAAVLELLDELGVLERDDRRFARRGQSSAARGDALHGLVLFSSEKPATAGT